jgi:pimeloyl-ACP methyl ester carboxylesterase
MKQWPLTETYQFQSHEIRYGVAGAGAPLVLIHGTPFSSYEWRRIIPCLTSRYRVYYFDLLGYGQSARAGVSDVSLAAQNHLFTELLDHWQIECPDVVAHDFGGTTALRCHLLNGRDFRTLTLIDPVALSPWGSPFSSLVRAHIDVFSALPPAIHDALLRAYLRSSHTRPLAEEDLEAYVRPWIGEIGQAAFYRQIAQFDRRYTDEVESKYGQVRCPTMILWGEADQWIPLEMGQRLKERIPGSELVSVPLAGHLMHEDAPEAIVGAVIRFLDEGRPH